MSPNAYAVYKKSLLCLLLGICVKKLNFLSCKHDPLVTAWCYLDAFFFFFFGSKSVCLNLTLSINVTYYFKTVISGHWPSVGWLFLLFCCLFFLITLKHLSASCMSQEMGQWQRFISVVAEVQRWSQIFHHIWDKQENRNKEKDVWVNTRTSALMNHGFGQWQQPHCAKAVVLFVHIVTPNYWETDSTFQKEKHLRAKPKKNTIFDRAEVWFFKSCVLTAWIVFINMHLYSLVW